MSDTPTLWQRLRISSRAIFWFALLVLFGLSAPILLSWPWAVSAGLAGLAFVLCLPIYLIRKVWNRSTAGWSPTRAFWGTMLPIFMVLTVLAALPIYWLAYWVDARPSVMPLATLTDGKKTVQFQGMQHIGSEGFYKSVVYDLREALGNGYKLYYEGVQPVEGRADLTDWFNTFATGTKGDLSGSYKTLADACGLQFQLDYFRGLTKDMEVHPARHLTADVTYLDMKTEYDRLMKDDAAFAAAMAATVMSTPPAGLGESSITNRLLSMWKEGTQAQKKLLGLACRGFFSWSNAQHRAHAERDKLILDFRNKKLAEQIAGESAPKIYITYGAAHLPGVIADLKKIDPNWKMTTVKWSRVIANPEEYQGNID